MTDHQEAESLVERLTQAGTWQREDLVSLCFKAAWTISALLERAGEGTGASQSQPGYDGERAASVGSEPSGADGTLLDASGPVLAVAEAWASIDGKLEAYQADDGSDQALGYREGYESDAASLIERLARRGYLIVPGPEALSLTTSTHPRIEGEGISAVARADMTPPSGASDGQRKSEGGGA